MKCSILSKPTQIMFTTIIRIDFLFALLKHDARLRVIKTNDSTESAVCGSEDACHYAPCTTDVLEIRPRVYTLENGLAGECVSLFLRVHGVMSSPPPLQRT